MTDITNAWIRTNNDSHSNQQRQSIMFAVIVITNQTMSAQSEEPFSYLDSVTPVTPQLAYRFLKEAFKCRCDDGCYEEEWTNEEAKSIIEYMYMIQDDIMALDLDLYDIYLLFERDVGVTYHFPPGGGEVFRCNPPGFTIMMTMPLLKKTLWKQLFPNVMYAGSSVEHTLDNMDEIVKFLNDDF